MALRTPIQSAIESAASGRHSETELARLIAENRELFLDPQFRVVTSRGRILALNLTDFAQKVVTRGWIVDRRGHRRVQWSRIPQDLE